ncbi:response regulator transcription factor [Shewanella sp. JM162201]|uniref:Response regulator transcription factor n=1 Tax=Shewanella jiangmenensis TaxID=2837387 RepID=A0ABS5V3M3_9GAMM|nr:response regulator transcription factor [Shewanella jiangmenensis]MBT1444289.1 response regulator transcription factor [Shewanella jiangmenensis]
MGSAVTPVLLLIEDDLPLAELIITFLENQQFTLIHADSIEAALKACDGKTIDLIICDVMLPGQDGFAAFPTLSRKFAAPVIFMTALANTEDEIHGLELGAVDYITKPVMPGLLLARINARLRRQSKPDKLIWQRGELQLHRAHQQLSFGERHFELTTQETELLWILLSRIDEVLSREFLFERFIGREYDGLDRAMDLKISRLRRKLEQFRIPGLNIRTVHGRGYVVNFAGEES